MNAPRTKVAPTTSTDTTVDRTRTDPSQPSIPGRWALLKLVIQIEPVAEAPHGLEVHRDPTHVAPEALLRRRLVGRRPEWFLGPQLAALSRQPRQPGLG